MTNLYGVQEDYSTAVIMDFYLPICYRRSEMGAESPKAAPLCQQSVPKGLWKCVGLLSVKLTYNVLHYNCTYKVETSKTSVQYMKEKNFQ